MSRYSLISEKDKPYWVNPENGVRWYVDKHTTQDCSRYLHGVKPLKAVCFIVAQPDESGKIVPVTRVLVSTETNEPLFESKILEHMAARIDMLRLAASEEQNNHE